MASGAGSTEDFTATRRASLVGAAGQDLTSPPIEVERVDTGEDSDDIESDGEGGGPADDFSLLAPTAAVGQEQHGLSIRDAPILQLVAAAPPDLAAEFEERLAELELELEEEKEKAKALSREWAQRYQELEIHVAIQESQISALTDEIQREREKAGEDKKKLKQLYLENDTIEIIENEVNDVMALRDRELEVFRKVKDEEIQKIRERHISELKILGDRFSRLLLDAQRANELKVDMLESIGTNKGVLLQDPLHFLEFLSDIQLRLVDTTSVFGAGSPTRALTSSWAAATPTGGRQASDSLAGYSMLKSPASQFLSPRGTVKRDYEGTLALMQDVMQLERAQKPTLDLGSQTEKGDISEFDALEEATVLAQLEREEASEKLQELQQYLEALSTEAKQQPTSLQTMATAHQMATDAAARFHQAVLTEKEVAERRAVVEKGQREVRLRNLVRDPLLSRVAIDSEFADSLEAVLRENERLKARLQVLGDGPTAGLSEAQAADKRAQLTEVVDDLAQRAETLSLACERLDRQRYAFKLRAQETAREIAPGSAEATPARFRERLDDPRTADIWNGDTDSEDLRSVEESSESDDDQYDPAEILAQDQIAGVEELIEEPEEFEPEEYELEKKQFLAAMRKEAHVASLVEQILQYLECGTVVFRLDKSQMIRSFAFLAHNRSIIQVCDATDGGKPNRKDAKLSLRLRDVREILIGQFSDRFKTMLKRTETNLPVDPAKVASVVPKDSESVDWYNSGLYFYRSITLKMREGAPPFDFVCNTDSDFETWVVALHRITTLDPHYDRALDIVAYDYPGLSELDDTERDFCSRHHMPPLLYLNAKMQCLKQQNKVYLTLYDVRTLSGFDLLNSQKVFELWMLSGYIEKQYVYQIRYLERFPEEASSLVQMVDAERQRERRKEQQRLLYGDH
eukprot:Hpha_TRINITY_DN16242_c0_g2::TRINITY_DN16242_c0_g2_i2::g.12830::m.12830